MTNKLKTVQDVLPYLNYNFSHDRVHPRINAVSPSSLEFRNVALATKPIGTPGIIKRHGDISSGLRVRRAGYNLIASSAIPGGLNQIGNYAFTEITDRPHQYMSSWRVNSTNHPTDNHNQFNHMLPGYLANGIPHTLSCYVKQIPGNTNKISLLLSTNYGPSENNRGFTTFTLGDENGNGATAMPEQLVNPYPNDPNRAIEFVGNGWYRIHVVSYPVARNLTQYLPTTHFYIGSNVQQNNAMAMLFSAPQVEQGVGPSVPLWSGGSPSFMAHDQISTKDTFSKGTVFLVLDGKDIGKDTHIRKILGIGNATDGITLSYEKSLNGLDNYRHGWMRFSYFRDNRFVGITREVPFKLNGNVVYAFSFDVANQRLTIVIGGDAFVFNMIDEGYPMREAAMSNIVFGDNFNLIDLPTTQFNGIIKRFIAFKEILSADEMKNISELLTYE